MEQAFLGTGMDVAQSGRHVSISLGPHVFYRMVGMEILASQKLSNKSIKAA
jgi:hypothetical protein